AERCTSIYLDFTCEGYYTEKRWFTTGWHGLDSNANPANATNLRIVLQKQGTLVHLTDITISPTISTDGSGAFFDLSLISTQAVLPYKSATSISHNSIYVTAELNDTGQIASVDRPSHGDPTSGYFRVPKSIVLRTADPDGGFIRFNPAPGRSPK